MSVSLTFEQRPVPWSRTLRGEKTERSGNQRKYINDLALMLKVARNKTGQNFDGAVSVKLLFDYKRNQTFIEIYDANYRDDLRTKRADLDNLCKMVLEALQRSGIVNDDAQVAMLEAEKIE